MSRIPLTHPRSLYLRAMEAYSKRSFGAVLEPGLAMLHNRQVLKTIIKSERLVARWGRLDPVLKAIAVLATSREIGCSWCLDYGYWESVNQGVPAEKLRAVEDWQTTKIYSDTERAVVGYAVAMTQTPPSVTDEMVADLRTRLSDAELVELTAMIAVENRRSRINAAFGLTSQGFKDQCDLPAASRDAELSQLRS